MLEIRIPFEVEQVVSRAPRRAKMGFFLIGPASGGNSWALSRGNPSWRLQLQEIGIPFEVEQVVSRDPFWDPFKNGTLPECPTMVKNVTPWNLDFSALAQCRESPVRLGKSKRDRNIGIVDFHGPEISAFGNGTADFTSNFCCPVCKARVSRNRKFPRRGLAKP